jgi:phosphotransferase system enzyme I (PtsP)
MAGRPLEAMTLIGLGFRCISMAPASIGPIKSMVLSLDAGALERWLADNMRSSDGSLRAGLKRFAEEQGVEI